MSMSGRKRPYDDTGDQSKPKKTKTSVTDDLQTAPPNIDALYNYTPSPLTPTSPYNPEEDDVEMTSADSKDASSYDANALFAEMNSQLDDSTPSSKQKPQTRSSSAATLNALNKTTSDSNKKSEAKKEGADNAPKPAQKPRLRSRKNRFPANESSSSPTAPPTHSSHATSSPSSAVGSASSHSSRAVLFDHRTTSSASSHSTEKSSKPGTKPRGKK